MPPKNGWKLPKSFFKNGLIQKIGKMYYFLINAIFTGGQKERSILFEKKELDIMLKIYNTAVANLKKIIKRDFISRL